MDKVGGVRLGSFGGSWTGASVNSERPQRPGGERGKREALMDLELHQLSKLKQQRVHWCSGAGRNIDEFHKVENAIDTTHQAPVAL